MNSLKQETELLEYLCEENSSLVERYQMGRESYTQSSKWHTESTTEVLWLAFVFMSFSSLRILN